jgi:hypothetical protein
MTPQEAIALIAQGADMARRGLEAYSALKEALSSEDAVALKEALVDLQRANDEAFERVMGKLEVAARPPNPG